MNQSAISAINSVFIMIVFDRVNVDVKLKIALINLRPRHLFARETGKIMIRQQFVIADVYYIHRKKLVPNQSLSHI